VFLDTQEYPKIAVTGVTTPGLYEYDENLTLTSLLAQAGNPTPDAALSKAYIQRSGKILPLNLTQNGLTSPEMATFKLMPGDALFIPQNLSRVGVIGEVSRPSFYTLPETKGEATMLRLLSNAGGPTVNGDLENVTITRVVDGENLLIPVNAAAIVAGTSPDIINLQPNDVINVPKKDAFVNIIGPVGRPGAYAYTPGMTIVSLLAAAGNPTASAGLSRAYVLRDGKQIPLNLRSALIEGKNDEGVTNFKLTRGDYLVIPDTSDEVSVTGQVVKPGAYNLDDNLTVVSLLARAGNTTPAASLSRAYVLRGNEQIPLNLRTVLGTGTPDAAVLDFRFQAGDMLVIPENQLRISVIGAVTRPGAYPYPEFASEATLLKAIGMAGGPVMGSGGANLKKASVVRTTGNQTGVFNVDLSTLFSTDGDSKTGTPASTFVMQPGDTLYIPASGTRTRVTDLFGPLAVLGSLF
jgi:protein involved in polysaccharide export with SLBB domain